MLFVAKFIAVSASNLIYMGAGILHAGSALMAEVVLI